MITIFKNREDIPKEMEYVALNDLFFNQSTVSKIDEKANLFVKKIDNSELISKYKIRSRFDETALNIDHLSSGCKTILNVLYYPEKVFSLKECGDNVLEVLYNLEKGNVYSDYPLIPFDMNKIRVKSKLECKEICDYEELKEWWLNEN